MTRQNNHFAIKRTVTGLGLFTLKLIPADKKIIEYVGTILSNEEVAQRSGKYFFELDEKRAIDGSARSNLARYINHSCRPNAKGYTHGRRIWIWSLREIAAGEQITINYGKSYFNDHIKPVGCKCDKCTTKQKKKLSSAKRAGKK